VVIILTRAQAILQWMLKENSIDRKTRELLLRVTSSWGHFTGGRRCRLEAPRRIGEKELRIPCTPGNITTPQLLSKSLRPMVPAVL